MLIVLLLIYVLELTSPFLTVNGEYLGLLPKDIVIQKILEMQSDDVYYTLYEKTISTDNTLSYNIKGLDCSSIIEWINPTVIINKEINTDFMSSLNRPMSNAEIEITNDGKFILRTGKYGLNINTNDIVSKVESGVRKIILDDYVIKSEVSLKEVIENFHKVKWLNDWSITYDNGTEITSKDLLSYIVNYELVINKDDLRTIVESMQEYYDNEVSSIEFIKTGETTPSIIEKGKWGTVGRKLNINKELTFLYNAIMNRESHLMRTPYTTGYDKVGNTYVEISIEQQHLWYYKDGILHSDTDIVTGTVGKHDTPRGLFYMSECLPDRVLRGPGYESPVDYWMRLTNSGIGLHDATWRDKFGDNIYKTSGSHGCINLPHKFATVLFKESYVGLPVIIY